MGDDTTPPKDAPDRHGAVPWVQALCVIGALALAAFDLTIPESDVPLPIYSLPLGVAVGIDPGLINRIRGGGPQ